MRELTYKRILSAAMSDMKLLSEEFHESVGLAVILPDKPKGLVLGQVKGDAGFSFYIEEGHEFNLYTSAPGKAILAQLPSIEQDAIIENIRFEKFTDNTITSAEQLNEALSLAKQRGYATDVSEEVQGCHCVSACVMSDDSVPIAAVWVTGPSNRIRQEDFPNIAESIQRACLNISHKLTWTSSQRKQEYMESVIARAEKYIFIHYSEDLDMEGLANQLHVGYTWFRRSFKKFTGKSPKQCLIDYRIEKACYLLRNTDLSVGEISQQLGFTTQDYFSTIFKKKQSLSPKNFRASE